jgi:hypothetical protein
MPIIPHWFLPTNGDSRLDRLEVSPNLWAGFGLIRGGAGSHGLLSGSTPEPETLEV